MLYKVFTVSIFKIKFECTSVNSFIFFNCKLKYNFYMNCIFYKIKLPKSNLKIIQDFKKYTLFYRSINTFLKYMKAFVNQYYLSLRNIFRSIAFIYTCIFVYLFVK